MVYFSPDFESKWGYNRNTDYNQVATEYNTLTEDGNREQAKRLLDLHGGKLALVMKREYQRQKARLFDF